MDTANAKPKSSWTSGYTLLVFAMVALLYVQFLPSWLNRPDLAVLKPISMALFWAIVPIIPLRRQLEAGNLTRGWMAFILVLYFAMGTAFGITIYEELLR